MARLKAGHTAVPRKGEQIGPFWAENLRSSPRTRQTEKRPGGAEIPVG